MCTVLWLKTTHRLAARGAEEEQSDELLREPERQSQPPVRRRGGQLPWASTGQRTRGPRPASRAQQALRVRGALGRGVTPARGPPLPHRSPKGLPALTTDSETLQSRRVENDFFFFF